MRKASSPTKQAAHWGGGSAPLLNSRVSRSGFHVCDYRLPNTGLGPMPAALCTLVLKQPSVVGFITPVSSQHWT